MATYPAYTKESLGIETFKEQQARFDAEHLERLAFIRGRLKEGKPMFDGGNDLVYIIHPNTHEDRAKYPWQVTTLGRNDDGTLTPYSHTTHKFLDLDEDHGCYYASAVWEIAWSVTVPGMRVAR